MFTNFKKFQLKMLNYLTSTIFKVTLHAKIVKFYRTIILTGLLWSGQVGVQP